MTVGDVASIVSIVLACVAIALSIVFFRMSTQLSEAAKNAAQRIGASVDRLENLFNKLYSDTFSLMKDTYQDMRKHAWPEGAQASGELMAEAERKTDEKLSMLNEKLDKQLDEVLGKQMRTENQIDEVKHEVRDLVGRAISESRKVEEQAREETMRDRIIGKLKRLVRPDGYVLAQTIVDSLIGEFPGTLIVRELERMRDDGLISFEGKLLEASTMIQLGRS